MLNENNMYPDIVKQVLHSLVAPINSYENSALVKFLLTHEC